MKTIVTSALVSIVVVALGLTLFAPAGVVERIVERPQLGADSPEKLEHQVFRQGATMGGVVTSTSTAESTATLLARDIVTSRGQYTSILRVTPTSGNLTLTLPATSTLANFIPNSGDSYTLLVENAATAATTTTIAAGAGMDLQEPDGQNVVLGQNNYAVLTFWRESTGDMVVTVDEHIPGD